MSTTRGVRTLVGLTLASSALLLGGCASSGTTPAASGSSTGAAASTGSSAASTSASSSDSAASSASSSDSAASDSSSSSDSSGSSGGSLGGSDAGCQAAISDVANGPQALSGAGSNPAAAVAAIKGIGDKLHADAAKSSGAGAAAINKVADDYIGLANSVGKGTMPDTSSLMTDATAMTKACGL
jgi:hypothetical protein